MIYLLLLIFWYPILVLYALFEMILFGMIIPLLMGLMPIGLVGTFFYFLFYPNALSIHELLDKFYYRINYNLPYETDAN